MRTAGQLQGQRAAEASREMDADVLILGAGMAGLGSARVLAEAGLRVIVLEARERVGGRIFTEGIGIEEVGMASEAGGGVLVEHGAEFVHGRPAALWQLLRESGLLTVERDGAMLREHAMGAGVSADEDSRGEDFFAALEQLADLPGEDVSFADWLGRSDLPPWQREALTDYVEGFNAADARRISARSLGIQQRQESEHEGDRGWHLPAGYARLPEFTAERARAAGADLRLQHPVHAVRWREGEVVVSGRWGDVRAPRCLVTLPLGVLHAANSSDPHSVRIEPEPRPLFEARRLAMGHVARFTLVFRERWWAALPTSAAVSAEALRTLSFVFTPERMPPVWWTRQPEPERYATLVGWSGGPRSEELRACTPAELGGLACTELAAAFCTDRARLRELLVGVYTHDWSRDPYSLGSYSYVPAGALDAAAAMGEPVAGTLFFAGEHTDVTGNWGTVHAALGSGLRAAQQVLQARAQPE